MLVRVCTAVPSSTTTSTTNIELEYRRTGTEFSNPTTSLHGTATVIPNVGRCLDNNINCTRIDSTGL